MTEEAQFYRGFVADVRDCSGGRSPAYVAEIERRVRVALTAGPALRERRWARVVAVVGELLASLGPDHHSSAAARLRAFARENAALGPPRDAAITDFHIAHAAQGVLVDRNGRSYAVFRSVAQPLRPPIGTLDECVPRPARRFAEAAAYGLCGGAMLAALWFSFVVPV